MSETQKAKTLFDHLNNITAIQNPDYYDKLSDEDRKTWSNFMIHRFLSMNYDYVELIADPTRPTSSAKIHKKMTQGCVACFLRRTLQKFHNWPKLKNLHHFEFLHFLR